MNNKIYSMLGFAARSGNIALGEGKVMDSIRSRKAKVVLVSEDASENTRKKVLNSCEFYGVTAIKAGDRYELGRAVGREFAVTAAVTNMEMAVRIKELSRNAKDSI